MGVRRLSTEQPDAFAFTPENKAWADKQIAQYPEGRQASAVIAILWRAQEQHKGWLPEPAIRLVADMLDMPYIRVFEIATFYTMFQLQPVGSKAHFQICGTTPCMLRGSEDLISVCKKRIAATPHTLSADGAFSWEEVECLGMCVNAPVVQMHVKSYEDLTPEQFEGVIDAYDRGEDPAIGPQNGRQYSAPLGGAKTLTELDFSGSSSDLTEKAANAGAAAKPKAKSGADAPSAKTKKSEAKAEVAAPTPKQGGSDAGDQESSVEAATEGTKPEALEGPRGGKADDLKKIKGVGKVIEDKLHKLGIYHFDQVAKWGREEVAWVDGVLSFKGRIDREDWIAQAKVLADEK